MARRRTGKPRRGRSSKTFLARREIRAVLAALLALVVLGSAWMLWDRQAGPGNPPPPPSDAGAERPAGPIATLPPAPLPPPRSFAVPETPAEIFAGDRPPPEAATAEPLPVEPPPVEPPPVEPSPAVPVVTPPPAQEGAPAWLRNAIPSQPTPGRPMIAVVIDDMGIDRRRSARTAALPGPLTLAWLPYARDLRAQTAEVRRHGHEFLLHLPMEPRDLAGNDPGPGAILTGLGPDEVRRRVAAALGAFDGYIGLNNHMGSRFTEDRAGMAIVAEELKKRGLLFLDSRTSPRSVGLAVARQAGIPALGRDVFIDDDMAPAAVQASLAKMERVARSQGYAIGIGHPHDVTIEALANWLPGLAAKGFTVVPLSAVMKMRMAGGT